MIIDYEIWIQKENDDKFAKYIISENDIFMTKETSHMVTL